MSQNDVSSWLPNLLGILTVKVQGVVVKARRALNFKGDGFSVTSNATDDAIDVELEEATTSAAGIMSAEDKEKLDGLQTQGTTVAMAALEVDWSAGSTFSKTLAAGANAITFANAASGQVIIVELTSDAGGSTVTWPTVKWTGGTPPTQTSTGQDVYTFVKIGTTIHGAVQPDQS